MVSQASPEITEQVAALFGTFPEKQRAALTVTRERLHALLPAATEDMSWGMPTLRVCDVIVVSLLGFKGHNSLFPGPDAINRMGSSLDGYTVTKGTIHFDKEVPCTKAFLKVLVAACIASINDRYPKKSGEFLEFYSNGVTKATGKYKGEAMHGAWRFYRQDGTLKRSGSFTNGAQTGEWVTYDASGTPYKTTNFG